MATLDSFTVAIENDQIPWGCTTLESSTLENSGYIWRLLAPEGGKEACLCQAVTKAAQNQPYTSLPGLGTVWPA